MVERQPHASRCESNHEDCQFDIKHSADQGSHKVREIMGLYPENPGEALGKPRGLGWKDVGVISPLCQLLCFS